MSAYPSWVRDRASFYRVNPPRLESSLYGLVNAILTTIFTADEGYMVKPQPKLRALAETDTLRPSLDSQRSGETSSSSLSEMSMDSHGRVVGTAVRVPDFVVVRADGPVDVAVLAVEVKASPAPPSFAQRLQLRRYLERLTDTQGAPIVGGILCNNVGCTATLMGPSYSTPADVCERQRLEGATIERFMQSLKTPPYSPGPPLLPMPSTSSTFSLGAYRPY